MTKKLIYLLFLFSYFYQNNLLGIDIVGIQKNNDYKIALEYYDKANLEGISDDDKKTYLIKSFNLSISNGFDSLALNASIDLCWFYLTHIENTNNNDTALYHANINKKLFSKIFSPNKEIKNNSILSTLYLNEGKSDSTLYFIKESDSLIENNKEKVLLSTKKAHYSSSFHMLIDLMKYEEALKLIDKIEVIANELNSPVELSRLQILYSKLYEEAGNTERVIEYSKKALNFHEDSSLITYSRYKKIAESYKELNIIDSSFLYFNKAIKLCSHDYPHFVNGIYYHIAYLYSKKDLEKAEFYFNLLDTNKIKDELPCQLQFLKAKLANNIKEKEALCLEAISCNPTLEIQKNIYDYLNLIFKDSSELKLAIYYRKLNLIKDSLNIKNRQPEIQKSILRNELNKKELLIAESNKKLSKQEYKVYYYLAILIILIVLLTILIIFLINYKEKGDTLLDEKRNLINEISNKNKLLEEASFSIEKNIRFIERTKENISNVNNLTNLYAETNIYLAQINRNKEFNDSLKNIKEDFIKNLGVKFTVNEKKIIILIKAGLTSKEIAGVLNVKKSSIEKYRYNIKKKLNLSKSETLGDYIKNL